MGEGIDVCPESVPIRRLGLPARDGEIRAGHSAAKGAVGSIEVVEVGAGVDVSI
jgi:hypothetical protein